MNVYPHVVHTIHLSDGSKQTVVDPNALEIFKNSIQLDIGTLESKTNTLQSGGINADNQITTMGKELAGARSRIRELDRDVSELQSFIKHLMVIHPEWQDSWVKTEAVKQRLEESSYAECEVQEAIV
jgi:predicted  nucleic acid-binding Zn-ribbon protein